MKLSPAMKRMMMAIGDAWLIEGHKGQTGSALINRGLIERVTTHERRGILFTREGVEVYLKLREGRDE